MIEGVGVVLRALARDDLPRCLAWYNDPEVARLLGRPTGSTLGELEDWFGALGRRPDERAFAIFARGGAHIGNVYLRDIDPRRRRASVGIVLGERGYWGRGLGREALGLLLDFAFRRMGLRRISLEVLRTNARAFRAYRGLGFQVKGMHREEVFPGFLGDVLHMRVTPQGFIRPSKALLGGGPLSYDRGITPCPNVPSATGTSSIPTSSTTAPPAVGPFVATIGPPTTTA